MKRKYCVALAAAIRAFYDDYDREPIHTVNGAVEYLADNIADTLAADNPRFDRARFLKACGVQS